MNARLYYLTVVSWAGIAPGATHLYGVLRWREQGELHEDALVDDDGNRKGFSTEEALETAAIAWWEKNGKCPSVLVRGLHYVDEPQEVLAGCTADGNNVTQKARDLYAKAVAANFWDGGKDAEMKRICAAWEALFEGGGT